MTLQLALITILVVTSVVLAVIAWGLWEDSKHDARAIEHLLDAVHDKQEELDVLQDQFWGISAAYEYTFEELGETIDALWEARNQIRELEDMLDGIAAAYDITDSVEIVTLEENHRGEYELRYSTPPF